MRMRIVLHRSSCLGGLGTTMWMRGNSLVPDAKQRSRDVKACHDEGCFRWRPGARESRPRSVVVPALALVTSVCLHANFTRTLHNDGEAGGMQWTGVVDDYLLVCVSGSWLRWHPQPGLGSLGKCTRAPAFNGDAEYGPRTTDHEPRAEIHIAPPIVPLCNIGSRKLGIVGVDVAPMRRAGDGAAARGGDGGGCASTGPFVRACHRRHRKASTAESCAELNQWAAASLLDSQGLGPTIKS